jgi:myo-inositol-1(or 4)-monophosphatase
MSLEKEMRRVVLTSLKESGRILMEGFGKHLDIKVKESIHSIATQADTRAEKMIISMIRKSFPGHSILAEESGLSRGDSEYMWVIDPLDGTTNYSMMNPVFNTSVGVARGEEMLMGGVYAPVTKELFFAEKGKGATLNGKRIRVSQEGDLSKLVLIYCHGNDERSMNRASRIYSELKLKSRDMRRMGSGLLELSYVASGRAGCYIAPGTSPWDAATGSLIVREAGGKVTDFQGREFSLKSRDILASNGKIHQKLLDAINRIEEGV